MKKLFLTATAIVVIGSFILTSCSNTEKTSKSSSEVNTEQTKEDAIDLTTIIPKSGKSFASLAEFDDFAAKNNISIENRKQWEENMTSAIKSSSELYSEIESFPNEGFEIGRIKLQSIPVVYTKEILPDDTEQAFLLTTYSENSYVSLHTYVAKKADNPNANAPKVTLNISGHSVECIGSGDCEEGCDFDVATKSCTDCKGSGECNKKAILVVN